MKNNKFLLALAVCIGLSPIMSFSMVRAAGSKDKTATSSWMPSWSATTANAMRYWQKAKDSAAAAAASIRSSLPSPLSGFTYQRLIQSLTVLVMTALAMGYNKETVQGILDSVLKNAGALTSAGITAATYVASTAGSAVGTVATTVGSAAIAHPIVTAGLIGTGASIIAQPLDEAEAKKSELRGRKSSPEPIKGRRSRSASTNEPGAFETINPNTPPYQPTLTSGYSETGWQ